MLTDKQSKVLRYISEYIAKHEFAPTQTEISAAMGSTGPAILRMLDILQRKGYVERDFQRHRAIKVLKEAA